MCSETLSPQKLSGIKWLKHAINPPISNPLKEGSHGCMSFYFNYVSQGFLYHILPPRSWLISGVCRVLPTVVTTLAFCSLQLLRLY